jgi:hypothetical protein
MKKIQTLNSLPQAAKLLTLIRKVNGSNLDRDIDYPEVFRSFPLSLHINIGIVP